MQIQIPDAVDRGTHLTLTGVNDSSVQTIKCKDRCSLHTTSVSELPDAAERYLTKVYPDDGSTATYILFHYALCPF